MNKKRTSSIAVWWRAFRYHFVPPSIFPAVLGAVIGWAVDHKFSEWYFLLAIIGVTVNHVALNMADDYFDYRHSVDQLKPGEKNPYTGGSGTLSAGLISPSSMFKAFAIGFFVTASIGVYLSLARGWPVFAIGMFGGFCSVFYTAPPISFSHHGLGELGLLVNFGTVIGLGSYFVQTQTLTPEAFLATLPMGIMLFSMIVINEIPDIDEDRRAGKLTLVARYGKNAGVKLYVLSWLSTYSVIVVSVALGLMSAFSLISLVSLPLVLRSITVLKNNYDDPIRMAPANLDMIKAHSVTGLGLITAYSLQGWQTGAQLSQLAFIWLLLIILYTPAAVVIFKSRRKSVV